MSNIKEFVDQIIEDGIITGEEHERFMELVHLDGEIDEEESAQISRIFQLIQSGDVKVVDTEREKLDRQKIDQAKAEAVHDDLEQRKRERTRAELLESKAECSVEQVKQQAIADVVGAVERERAEQRNTIAEFIEGEKEAEKPAETKKAPSSTTNSMLREASKRLQSNES